MEPTIKDIKQQLYRYQGARGKLGKIDLNSPEWFKMHQDLNSSKFRLSINAPEYIDLLVRELDKAQAEEARLKEVTKGLLHDLEVANKEILRLMDVGEGGVCKR